VVTELKNQCTASLSRYPQTIEQDKELLKDESLTERAKIAIKLRMEEKEIFRSILILVDTWETKGSKLPQTDFMT